MKYGLSFNTAIECGDIFEEVGAPYEDNSGNTITAISDSIDRLEQFAITNESDVIVVADRTQHFFIGKVVEDSGKVVSVLTYEDDGEQVVLAVVFEDPDIPIVC